LITSISGSLTCVCVIEVAITYKLMNKPFPSLNPLVYCSFYSQLSYFNCPLRTIAQSVLWALITPHPPVDPSRTVNDVPFLSLRVCRYDCRQQIDTSPVCPRLCHFSFSFQNIGMTEVLSIYLSIYLSILNHSSVFKSTYN